MGPGSGMMGCFQRISIIERGYPRNFSSSKADEAETTGFVIGLTGDFNKNK